MRGLPVSALAMAGATAFATLTFGASAAKADLAAPKPHSSCYGAVEADIKSCAANNATVDITYSAPSVYATASSTGVAQGLGTLEYQFQLLGPDVGSYVTVDIQTLLQWTTTGDGAAFADIHVDSGFGQTYHTICSYCGVGVGFNEDPSYTGTLQIIMQVGAVGTIDLEAQASAGTGGSATALADPLIYVDPSVANADQYSFAFSPGVTNGINPQGGVPEPSAWALMLLGFGLGGTTLRARRVQFSQSEA